MKFGSRLKEAILPDWEPFYLDYDLLKKKLGKAQQDTFTDRDETEFVEMLDANLEKVYAFHTSTLNILRQEINKASVQHGIKKEKINKLANDISRLEKFSRFNYTGFLKIVKKHDRYTDYILRPMFMVRLNQCPFWKENEDLDALLIQLSQLFSKIRDSDPVKASTSLQPILTGEERRTVIKRFFVHTDDIFELKTNILRHLPVLVYHNQDGTKVTEQDIDPPISTLYLDNIDMDTYTSRVESTPGSQIIRLRWYGSAHDNKSISFERRTLKGENQIDTKEKFIIKDKYVLGFLEGKDTFLKKSLEKMKASAKSQKDMEDYSSLVQSIQQHILDKHMEPVLRTYYKRTAFQIPGDSGVRMALDTDLCFIREDGDIRPTGCWRRPDADIDFPFSHLPPSHVNRYPYATFEVKLDLAAKEDEPRWVVDLQESGLLEEAYQFSKFVHGMAIMFDTRVPLLPYWLAQIDEDRKVLPVLPSQIPSVMSARKGKERAMTTERSALLTEGKPSYASIVRGDQSIGRESGPSTAILGEEEERLCLDDDPGSFVLPPGVKIPKKVTTSIKVEPKVFFANERTYFSWMRFGTMLTTFSLALFNAGDAVGKISGIVYTLIAISTLIYGVGLYYRRRELIRARKSGPYDEMWGPTVICMALMVAVGLNAYLKFTISTPSLLYFY
ncbi:hypothetical protein INT47_012549 [Mucor saturninus]|uniref:SPX domain-containing protein n=1 Tax=Mucor saturninus TaxID=64648 RepID=A0A8H7R289_9FUNG|nr:hypothetical protein INT47_012549 [Mucor saturninus]